MTLGRLVSIGVTAGFASFVPACDQPSEGSGFSSGGAHATGTGGASSGAAGTGTAGTAGSGNGAGAAAGSSASSGSGGSAGTAGSGGMVSSGGTAGSGAMAGSSGSGAVGGAPEFELLWKDEFDTLDPARWGTASHTFTENLAQFTPANVSVEGGFLKLALSAAPQGSEKPYLGAEVRTVEEFTYGRFEARARFASGSGLVSSLFTFYDHLPMDWNEIDVEFLGQYSDRIQYNTIFWNEAQTRLTHEHVDPLTFDPSADFHVYTIDWLPGEVRFSIDGELRHTETEGIAEFMTLPQKVMMNLWPANLPDWVGPVDPAAIPAESQYDWVAIYTLVP